MDIVEVVVPIMAIGFVPFIVWLNLHYKYKNRSLGQMSGDQMAELERMSRVADILDQRVNVLEDILDDEVPNWREKNDQTI
jgi:phage shock protein B